MFLISDAIIIVLLQGNLIYEKELSIMPRAILIQLIKSMNVIYKIIIFNGLG